MFFLFSRGVRLWVLWAVLGPLAVLEYVMHGPAPAAFVLVIGALRSVVLLRQRAPQQVDSGI
jgi:hypothetical protein